MKMNYSFLTGTISEFLSSKEIIREVKASSRIVSIAAKVNEDLTLLPDNAIKNFISIFYLNRPSENYSYLAAGELIRLNENGSGRFIAIEKQLKILRPKFLSNWNEHELNVPLFTGGMKFTVEHNNDPHWKDFNDTNWIMPELILLKHKGQNYIICNFYFTRNSSVSDIIGYFEKKICMLFDGIADIPPVLKINSTVGDTPKDRKKWKTMVNKALEQIENAGIHKVVLSRKVELILNSSPHFTPLLDKLGEKYPECAVFMFKNGSSVFFGATPEKLISFRGKNACIDALAGSCDNSPETHLFSEKNIKEHDFVIEYIRNIITPFIHKVELTRYHNTKKLNNISHIWSEISAEMKDGNVFPVIKELFPTPAVCGMPKEAAMSLIRKLEDHRRGLYAGLIGWFNFSDSEFYVSIRSALNTGRKIIAYAGCGIIEGSDADQEFDEAELKLIPILSLFKDENKIQPQYSLG